MVLEHGWAFGTGGTALADKTLQLAVTTGSKVSDYQADGRHNFTLEEFLRPFEQTAKLCHMTWRQSVPIASDPWNIRVVLGGASVRFREIADGQWFGAGGGG